MNILNGPNWDYGATTSKRDATRRYNSTFLNEIGFTLTASEKNSAPTSLTWDVADI